MRYRVLGPLEAGDPKQPLPLGRRKQRALLARLLLDADRTVGVERLVDDLWGEDVPETAVKMVQIYVSGLRKVLPPDTLITRGAGYSIRLDQHDELDLHEFERLQAAAKREPDPATKAALLTQALELWRGPALAEFSSEPFAKPEGDRLEELRTSALEDRIDADLELGRAAEVAPELEALTTRYPLRERLRGQLMLALYRSGRHGEALAAFQQFRATLDQELGLEPSPGLRALEQQILTHDEDLHPPPPATRATAPPGRDGELAQLLAATRAATTGSRRLVLITGEAGIGKSTLVEALLDATPSALAIRGQCIEHHGASEAYLPLLDGLARAAETNPEVRETLATRAPSWLQQLPWLATPQPAEHAHGATAQRMLRELIEGLEGLAATQTVILVLEDLQWADPSTLDLLGALLRRRHPARLLVVATRETTDPLVAELSLRGTAQELALAPLDAQAAAQVYGLDEPTAAKLVERAGGNPLFMRHLAAHLDSDDIPATLRAAIEARLNTLDPATREELEAAAVAGREFTQETVNAALEREAALDAPGIIEPRGTREWPDGTTTTAYAFTHALYRDVLLPRAPELHRRIGERLERAFGADAADEIAAHYVAGRRPAPAIRYLRLAADRSRDRRAYREAIGHLARALDATDDLPDGPVRTRARVELLSELGQAHVALEGWSSKSALGCLERARATAEGLDDREPLAAVLLALATLHEVRGEPAPALDAIGAGAEIRGADGAELMACALFHQGAFTRALEHAERGAADDAPGHYATFPATLGDNAQVSCHDWAALALWFLGRPTEALDRAHHALTLAHEPTRAYATATAAAQLAVLHACRDEPELASRYAQETVDAARDRGYDYRVAMGRVLRGWAQAAAGRADGVEEITCGLQASRATGAHLEDPFYLGLLADGHLRAGDHAAGLEAVAEALAIADRERAHYYDAELHRLKGELLLAQGDEAEPAFRLALDIARDQGARSLELRAALSLARAYPGPGTRALLAGAHERLATEDTPDTRAAADLLGGGDTRRDITVLAWEIPGEVSPAELRASHAAARTAATHAGGHVATEDEAGGLLYFGYPRDLDDAPRRAVRAGRALAESLHAAQLRLCAGIDTGTAVVAPVAGASLALGQTPRTAWRLAAAAPPGGILVSETTKRLCGGFAFEPYGPGHLATAEPTGGLTPLVGRAQELELLHGRWEQAGRGHGQAVVLTGEPGIGKSRLVLELTSRIDDVLELQCSEAHTSSALHPVAAHLRRARAERGSLTAAGVPAADAPVLDAWLDAEPEALRRAAVDAFVGYVLARAPLLLVVEDLHWADPSTLELLGDLLDAIAEARVLIVGTTRPGVRLPWPARSDVTRLALGPCSRAEAEALVAHVAALSPAAAESVIEHGDGVPLYLEELARAADGGGDAIPSTLFDSVTARLDRLSPDARAVARLGALIGREFGRDLLAAATEVADLDGALDELVASELVRRRGRGTRFAFRHALLQDVAAHTADPALHGDIARAIEREFRDLARTEPETVARHYELAGKPARALPYRCEAGRLALSRSAPAEAAAHIEQALANLPAAPNRDLELDLRIAQGNALLHSRGYASREAGDAYAKARVLCGAGDPRVLPILYGKWVNGFVRGRHDEVLELGRELRRLAEDHDPGALVVADRSVGWPLVCMGRFAEAREALDRIPAIQDADSRQALRQLYAHDPVVAGLATAAWALWGCGEEEAADARAREAIEHGRALEHPLSLMYALGTGALLASFQGGTAAAHVRGREALTLAEELAQPLWRAWILYALASAELQDGDPERAAATVRSGLDGARRTGAALFEPYALTVLAEAESRLGRPGPALECLQTASEVARRGSELFWQPRTRRALDALQALRG